MDEHWVNHQEFVFCQERCGKLYFFFQKLAFQVMTSLRVGFRKTLLFFVLFWKLVVLWSPSLGGFHIWWISIPKYNKPGCHRAHWEWKPFEQTRVSLRCLVSRHYLLWFFKKTFSQIQKMTTQKITLCRYKVMSDCWRQQPEDRPTFSKLLVALNTLAGALKHSATVTFHVSFLKSLCSKPCEPRIILCNPFQMVNVVVWLCVKVMTTGNVKQWTRTKTVTQQVLIFHVRRLQFILRPIVT